MSKRKEEDVDVYVYLLFDRNLCRINVSDCISSESIIPPPKPEIEIVVDFIKKKLPMGMRPLTLDHSKLYMLGGFHPTPSKSFHHFRELISMDAFDGLNKDIFAFDSTNNCFVEANDIIAKMNGGKTNPILAEFDGKVYVLASKDVCLDCYENPEPTFEVFDPSAGSWDILPDPPFYDKRYGSGLFFSNHFILGRRLFVETNSGPYFFDVDSKEWGSAVVFMHQFMFKSAYFSSSMMGSIAHYNGLTVAYTCDRLVAYQFSEDYELKSHRVLDELKELHQPPWDSRRGFIIHLGGGKMCFVLYGYSDDLHCCLVRVSIFLLSSLMMMPAVLSKHEYNLKNLLDHDIIPVLHRAFALWSPDSPTLDSSFKKAKCT